MNAPTPLPDPFGGTSAGWLEGRTALVTGGGQNGEEPGVGYAISRVFAAHGARVAVVDRDPAAADRTVEHVRELGGTAHAVQADVTDDADCLRAVEAVCAEFGGIDTLVNNVAVGDRAGLFEVTPERWHELMTINLTSAWLISRHVEPVLERGSAIVNISSVGVRARGPGMVYNVAKAGLENLTVGAANTLGPRGIRVNCVQVGAIWSSFAARAIPEKLREARREGTALRTEGSPWDIANAALFLASDRARWVSGQILSVDGGPGSPKWSGPERSAGSANGAAKAEQKTEGSRG